MRAGLLLMATLWTICGARRGVGKTHLALALCELLPDAVYVKLSHCQAQPGKPANIFSSEQEIEDFVARHDGCGHIVIEANALVRKGSGDVIIFIAAAAGRDNLREDQDELRERSHIAISPDADVNDWRSAIQARGKLSDPELVENIFNLLIEQQRFISRAEISVRSKIWFEVGDERVFGFGLARLLESIEQFGSLSEAARAINISYRCAWGLIKEAEKHLGQQLIIPQSGGAGGGKSTLSDDGRRLLTIFTTASREVAAYADARFKELIYQ
ncbi:MAG: winged helix-turn-helix domain-containing protein [Armatimonadota bacterium]